MDILLLHYTVGDYFTLEGTRRFDFMKKIEPMMPTNLRLPKSLLKRLKKIAKQNKTTQAEVIRHALWVYCDRLAMKEQSEFND